MTRLLKAIEHIFDMKGPKENDYRPTPLQRDRYIALLNDCLKAESKRNHHWAIDFEGLCIFDGGGREMRLESPEHLLFAYYWYPDNLSDYGTGKPISELYFKHLLRKGLV